MIETASIFRMIHGWEKHKQAFENYKINGIQPDFYGRDASLSYPHIHHVHLAQSAKTREKWATIHQNYYRTVPKGQPNEDFWFIYAYDEMEDKYLLLTIVGPDAHNNQKWGAFLRGLLVNFVEPWIEGRLADVV